jgi:transposase InsO family protein
MKPNLTPFHLLVISLAGWLNTEQRKILEYLLAENAVLLQQLGKKRLRLTDHQRRMLAIKGKELGRKLLGQWATIVTPDTILRWHRGLVALKWTYNRKGTGRPGVMKVIRDLAVRMGTENPMWGYRRIQGALENLGHIVSPTTVRNILRRHGIDPAPDRSTTTPWRTFLRSHMDAFAAMDFFTVEVWTLRGLVTYYVLFVMELKTRHVEVAGITPNPDGNFMRQIARNLTDPEDGFLTGKRFVILDRDGKFTDDFKAILKAEGTEVVHCPVRAPNANAYAERFVLSIKSECLDRMIFFGEESLRRAVAAYLDHYHHERNHQGVGNRLLTEPEYPAPSVGSVACRERIGGLLRFYYRQAA